MTDQNEPQKIDEPGTQGELDVKLGEAERQRDEYLAGWQRAKADLINYRKDEARRLDEVVRYGNEALLHEFLGVLDSFDLGLRALEKAGPVEKGIYLIKSQIEEILRQRGLQKIEVKIGDVFDPAKAEAIAEVDSEKPPGTIVDVISNGYSLHEKILRPARVTISKSATS